MLPLRAIDHESTRGAINSRLYDREESVSWDRNCVGGIESIGQSGIEQEFSDKWQSIFSLEILDDRIIANRNFIRILQC